MAIQIAAYLGFDPIILIGCDLSYSRPETVIQTGPDKFGDGTRLNLMSTLDDDPNHSAALEHLLSLDADEAEQLLAAAEHLAEDDL